MPADFEIGQFMSKVENLGGIARKNRFSVEITPPQSLNQAASAINFLAKTVSFPARTMGSTTYRSGGQFGLSVPYETTFEPVSLTMLNTNNHAPRIFWTNWLEHIQNIDSYNMQYYKNFIGQIKISHYNETHKEANHADYSVTLHEAWPKGIGAMEVGWENQELEDFEIDIMYSRWTSSGAAGTAGTGTAGR
jgi:hypothetical protein